MYYRYFCGGSEFRQLLGYVDTYVGDIIKNWINIKDIFYKIQNNEDVSNEEINLLNDLARKDFYIEYSIKKYEKMELITKEHIHRPRILEYAKPIQDTIQKLKPLCKINNIVTPNIIKKFY